ncbi:actin depolymerizing protein [Piromyces finnis]|uniref:Actin depolymerizing protein n=1 Tax=Piromyces finnis TaxID=1754191 RepID=A0A1Y1V206_9FUNG|nr:actin depolymerizing protein [Piromyces finnis]|eukprot:ORX45445.1 actin depolymerizing protein [Piromyces finnis]
MSMAHILNIDELDLSKYLEKLNLDSDDVKKDWGNAGSKVGLKIWRIENFKVVPWPENDYGKFYSGDSYIILNSYKEGESEKLYHDIHFWLGSNTSQDEAGTAAYKTVELDNYLGTSPVQHRELQGSESRLFISYFKNFIILNGGVDSGFNIVKPVEYKPQLFHIKSVGSTLTVTSVPLSSDSLNSEDVFVLDQGLKIYQWNGCKAAGSEKHKAMEFTSNLKSERSGKPEIKVFEQDDSDATPFWDGIGGKGTIKEESSTNKIETTDDKEKILIRLSNASGNLEFNEEARGSISLSMLDTNDVFVIDAQNEVFIWIGKNSNVKEKTNSFQYAMDYVKKTGKPSYIPITRVVEGNENAHFKSFF